MSASIADIYKTGIPLKHALYLIYDSLSDKKYKKSILEIINMINSGKSLSEGFSVYKNLYPDFFTGMVSIGEENGKLYEVFLGLKNFYEKINLIRSKIFSSLSYPIFILCLIFILGIVLINLLIPNFYQIYISMNIKPDNACRVCYLFIQYVNKNLIFSLSVFFIWGIIIPYYFLKVIKKAVNIRLFKKIKIMRLFIEYRIILILSIIISSGVNISSGLSFSIKGVKSEIIKNGLISIKKSISFGNTFYESLKNSGLCSEKTLSIIKISEESGTLSRSLTNISSEIERILNIKINRYLSFIEPALIILTGILILVFMIIFVLPIFTNLQYGMHKKI
ncbi:type II secretion system F family protein [Clostridium sp. BJN0001]|uniref:type II secretion system F family protein n=1 Tax=Clostridium sp. BJN0001 TaxID=2930219 RepID=UPI001FD35592|nr:type II secretion system F family protein [Clostridium sp. BJN0001]